MDHSAVKLGKRAPRHDHRTLLLASYLKGTLPPIMKERVWSAKAGPAFGMMANDRLGDCTCAGIGHLIQVWTANTAAEVTLTDEQVIGLYTEFCGYNPADPTTDQGGVELDVLRAWKSAGAGGFKIDAFMALEPKNQMHVCSAIDLFGGVYAGVALPMTAQNQRVWSVVPHAGGKAAAGSWGGHAIAVVDYNPVGPVCITWGELKQMTWQFWSAYMDEAYAILAPAWATAGRMAPSGFDFFALRSDLLLCAA